MVAAAILDFTNFKPLTVGRLKRAELRCRAKFGRNRSKHGRDYAIFQDGGRRHLGFLKFRKDIGTKESNGNVRILTGSS